MIERTLPGRWELLLDGTVVGSAADVGRPEANMDAERLYEQLTTLRAQGSDAEIRYVLPLDNPEYVFPGPHSPVPHDEEWREAQHFGAYAADMHGYSELGTDVELGLL